MGSTNKIDAFEFRNALGSFTTGVTIVTTNQGGRDVGLTANSFNSVSLDPPMVLWSLSKNSLSLPAFTETGFFAVHILAEDQQSLSGQFASKGADKFAGLSVDRGEAGVPLLGGCAARFVCRTAFQYEGGDHIIFVGEVLDFQHSERPPLLFHSGSYGKLNASVADAAAKEGASDFGQDFLGYLLARSYQQLLAPVKKELVRRELSLSQYYLISLLGRFSDKSIRQLQDILAMGDQAITQSELESLKERGFVEYGEDGEHSLVGLSESGHRLFVELASVFKAVEEDAERDLDYDQRQSLKLGLRQLIETTDPGAPKSWL